MSNYTLDELTRFTQNEKKMVDEVFAELGCPCEPSDASLDRIMAFARTYSARPSVHTGFIRMVLN